MIGLVWKDLYSARSGVFAILLFALAFGLLFKDSWTGPMIVTLLFCNIGNSTLTWDEQCQWNTFAVSSGIPRRTLVLSKFEAGAVFVAMGTLIGLIAAVVFTVAGFNEMTLVENLQGVALGAVVAMVVMCLTIAITYWTGDSAKAQYMSTGIMVVSIIAMVSGSIIMTEMLDGAVSVIVVMAVIAVVAIAVAYKASCNRLESRDL